MQSDTLIYILIGVLALSALVTVFGKALKTLIKVGFKSILGTIAIFTADFFLSPIGFSVGINIFTALVTGVLGIPGFIMLYALNWILQ